MGLADAAILQDIAYGSPEFRTYCERLGGVLSASALLATSRIVSDAGKEPFPEFPLVVELFDRFRNGIEDGERLFSEGVLFSGDSLFAESIGRCDFPGASETELVAALQKKILPLPDDVKVYPGHGPGTTIGWERQHNPYLQF